MKWALNLFISWNCTKFSRNLCAEKTLCSEKTTISTFHWYQHSRKIRREHLNKYPTRAAVSGFDNVIKNRIILEERKNGITEKFRISYKIEQRENSVVKYRQVESYWMWQLLCVNVTKVCDTEGITCFKWFKKIYYSYLL